MVSVKPDPDGNDTEHASDQEHNPKVWSGIISTGQSLAVGFDAPLSSPTDPAPGALKLHDPSGEYDLKHPDSPYLTLAPLQEPFRASGTDTYPGNIDGKTPHSAFTRQLYFLLKSEKHRRLVGLSDEHARELCSRYATTVHTAVGKNGASMSQIRKQGESNSYAASMFEARALTRLAAQERTGLSYDVILLTHGETDAMNPNHQYGEEILQMQADYEEDLADITGRRSEPVLILSQQNTSPPWWEGISEQVDVMWRVQGKSGGKVVCSGPKYQYGYVGGLHLDAPGYDRLGEKYAEVFWRCLVTSKQGRGDGFTPLHPQSVEMRGPRQILVRFNVPAPPLVWDDFLPIPHKERHQAWTRGRGFEVRDAAQNEVGIDAVTIVDEGESIMILLDKDQEPELTVCYAMTQDADGFPIGFAGGSGRGRMGHLRDSNKVTSCSATTLSCQVENGSREFLRCSSSWGGVAQFDLVQPGGNAILAFDELCPEKAYLGKPWSGPSGIHDLEIAHNLRNYCVSFITKT